MRRPLRDQSFRVRSQLFTIKEQIVFCHNVKLVGPHDGTDNGPDDIKIVDGEFQTSATRQTDDEW